MSFCWNTCFYNFGWISQVISGLNPLDFTGQICQISGWNPLDFMKSLVIAPTLHSSNWRVFAETLAFIIWVDFIGEIWVKSAIFHGWNLVDFMKSLVIAPTLHSSNWRVFAETLAFIILGGFHRSNLGEIHQISQVKSTRFQGEIHWISRVKSPTLHSLNWRVFAETLAFIILGGFHRWYLGEIHRISWNPPDFMVKSTGFHVKSIGFHYGFHEIRNVSFCVMIKYRSFVFRKTNKIQMMRNNWIDLFVDSRENNHFNYMMSYCHVWIYKMGQ